MKRSLVWLIVFSLVIAGCKGREEAAGGATETIAPAEPKPAATDSEAMTQTVDIESGRSDAEGGGTAGSTATTISDTAATQAPPPEPSTTTR